jgi:hypothetical protein
MRRREKRPLERVWYGWSLIIGNMEWNEELPRLEERLYEFAASEGYLP